MVEGARLESVCRGNSTVGSNPTLSAILLRARQMGPARQPPRWRDYTRTLRQSGYADFSHASLEDPENTHDRDDVHLIGLPHGGRHMEGDRNIAFVDDLT